MSRSETAQQGSFTLPGSTFKAFTAAAALDTGTVNENYVFTGYIDNDYWKPTGYGEWPWPRIKRTRVYHRTEPMNMTNCMLHSDNIYFADVALKIGQEKFIAYFNEKLGMDKSRPMNWVPPAPSFTAAAA